MLFKENNNLHDCKICEVLNILSNKLGLPQKWQSHIKALDTDRLNHSIKLFYIYPNGLTADDRKMLLTLVDLIFDPNKYKSKDRNTIFITDSDLMSKVSSTDRHFKIVIEEFYGKFATAFKSDSLKVARKIDALSKISKNEKSTTHLVSECFFEIGYHSEDDTEQESKSHANDKTPRLT